MVGAFDRYHLFTFPSSVMVEVWAVVPFFSDAVEFRHSVLKAAAGVVLGLTLVHGYTVSLCGVSPPAIPPSSLAQSFSPSRMS